MMQHKTGKDTTGKANANLRRTIVFRFLCGCRREELQLFIDLVFSQFQDFISGLNSTFYFQLLSYLRNSVDICEHKIDAWTETLREQRMQKYECMTMPRKKKYCNCTKLCQLKNVQ